MWFNLSNLLFKKKPFGTFVFVFAALNHINTIFLTTIITDQTVLLMCDYDLRHIDFDLFFSCSCMLFYNNWFNPIPYYSLIRNLISTWPVGKTESYNHI